MRTNLHDGVLSESVMAVPPLALAQDGTFDDAANRAIIRHLEAGGVSTILYGGNAMAQHWPMATYADWLDRLAALSADGTWLLPSIGPDAGKMKDQAKVLSSRSFPVALLLPVVAPMTQQGVADAIRQFHAEAGVQVLVYIKTDNYLAADILETLFREGAVYGVKYAVPRTGQGRDGYLDQIIAALGVDRVISGFGEPPAVRHMLDYDLAGYTAGCVCIAPTLSTALLAALQDKREGEAKRLLEPFAELENLRNEISEIRVLHEAIALSGLADTGPIQLPAHGLTDEQRASVADAASKLIKVERGFAKARKL